MLLIIRPLAHLSADACGLQETPLVLERHGLRQLFECLVENKDDKHIAASDRHGTLA